MQLTVAKAAQICGNVVLSCQLRQDRLLTLPQDLTSISGRNESTMQLHLILIRLRKFEQRPIVLKLEALGPNPVIQVVHLLECELATHVTIQ